MARPGRKKRTALFIVEIICLLLFIGGLYVYGQIDSRLNKIETPQLDESKIVTNVTAPQMSGYTTYALFGIDQRSKNAALDAQNSDTIIIASINNDTKEVKLPYIVILFWILEMILIPRQMLLTHMVVRNRPFPC